METGKIMVKNQEGKDIECDILFTFDSDTTNKSYIVYTDNTTDDLGNIKVYANTYNSDKESGELGAIETEEEWTVIEQIFSSIKSNQESKNE